MTERELLYIKTIADEKSISKAAEKLFLSQPSLSKCISSVETALGTKLFKRTNTGLIPTYAGERYYKIATEILKIYNDFEIEVSDINNLKKGRITIGLTTHLATLVLPVVLPAFKERCPNMEIFIVERNSTELEGALMSGQIDFAVMHMSYSDETSNNSNIKFHPLFKDPFLLATKKGHPLGRYAESIEGYPYPKIDLELFANEPFIMISQKQRIGQVSQLIFEKSKINPVVALTIKNFETARRLACQGMGVTFTPLQYSQIFTTDYPVDYYCIDEKYSPYWTLCIAFEKSAYISKAAKLFISMVSENFGSNILKL
jgi:DNA-binding transcriptional LysR family regulator